MPRIVKIVGRTNDDGSVLRSITVQEDNGQLVVKHFKHPSQPDQVARRHDEAVALGTHS